MKRSLLFLSLILCFAVVNAQNINVKQFKRGSARTEQKQNVKANPKQMLQALRNANHAKTPIPVGYARVNMIVTDIWGDGTGIQMLIDSNATAYGTIIPTTGSYSDTTQASINAAIASYSEYEFKIPQNADGNLSTTNMLLNTTASLDIPIGTYDYCIVNPTPTMTDATTGTVYPGKIYMASGDAAKGDDFTFAEGVTYTFYVGSQATVYLLQENDVTVYNLTVPETGQLTSSETISVSVGNIGGLEATNIPIVCKVNGTTLNATISSLATLADTTINFTADLSTIGTYNITAYSEYPNDANLANDTMYATVTSEPTPSINWDFQDGLMPAGFTIYSDENTPNTNIANMFPDGWNVVTLDSIEYFAASPSWFTSVAPADRWMITAKINLTTNNSLKFDIKSQDADYLESMAVKLSTTTNEKTAFTTELWSSNEVPATITSHTFDLSAYNNQNIYIAFILTSTDMFYGCVDNIKIFGQASGLNDIATSTFGVYPNPANDFITISNANGADVKVIDMLGRTLIAKTIKSSNETISINDLQTGMYMIQMVKDGKVSSQKLIKK